MAERSARVERETRETKVRASVRIDGQGNFEGGTGVGFFDHMLEIFARHAGFDVSLTAEGDLRVDAHHTVEDVGIVLGEALSRALGEKRSIVRFGTAGVPLDEALSVCHLDISGRGGFYLHGAFPPRKAGDFDADLAADFFRSFAGKAGVTIHLRLLAGDNPHHLVETAFKSVAVALRQAVAVNPRIVGVPSTKGVL